VIDGESTWLEGLALVGLLLHHRREASVGRAERRLTRVPGAGAAAYAAGRSGRLIRREAPRASHRIEARRAPLGPGAGPFQTLPGRATYEALWQLFARQPAACRWVQVAAYLASAVLDGWWPAYDTNAYWLAAKHILNGQPALPAVHDLGSGVYK